MLRHFMFIGNALQIAPQIQCSLPQNPSPLVFRYRETGPKIHVEAQGTQYNQNNLEKEAQSSKYSHFLISKIPTRL
jgi:hypothetical protein